MIRAISIFVLLTPSIALPCTCANMGKDSNDKVIEAACSVDAVFVGKATNQLSAPDHLRKVQIQPSTIYKGQLPNAVVIETATTCDHWFAIYGEYLIFGNIADDSNQVTTSICGPARYTSKLSLAQFQLEVLEEVATGLDELCSDSESAARQRRIASQDQLDREEAEAESLRLLKEGIKRGRVDYEEALEETRTERRDSR